MFEFDKEYLVQIASVRIRKEIKEKGVPPNYGMIREAVLQFSSMASGELMEQAVGELVRLFSSFSTPSVVLENNDSHKEWLTSERKKDRRYWKRYFHWIQEGRLPQSAIQEQDESSDKILSLLEDPKRPGAWDNRGLVVGHVQSGKTGSYSALINKAADAGYKIIIVLSGMLENLRFQTQTRLDEAFLGYESNGRQNERGTIVGVGMFPERGLKNPIAFTFRSADGDFLNRNTPVQAITKDMPPWLFVVKKNAKVLKNLLAWLNKHADSKNEKTGEPLITTESVLVIDDEADNASLDTGNPFDDDGKLDPDYSPKAINRLIRRILMAFSRKSYVGYTATPFANIFVSTRAETPTEGPDLFPSSFIINLGASSNYFGPSLLFGSKGKDSSLDLVREIKDAYEEVWRHGRLQYCGWMPPKHKKDHLPKIDGKQELPESLKEAVKAFILAYVVRIFRGQGKEHASMLIHVTRFQNVQKKVFKEVSEYLYSIVTCKTFKNKEYEACINEFKRLWEEDFVPTTRNISLKGDLLDELGEEKPKLPDWEWVEQAICDHVGDIEVREINGSSKDTLDYEKWKSEGFKVIAIGGDKLSRGLTLEGLMVSYFLRASKMYDSLMQMGRWYGYRPGYVDLCRLYTTSELIEWLGFIANASIELREEFAEMANRNATPRDFGLKVKQHPAMLITSQLKMRSAEKVYVSFSGRMPETTTFFENKTARQENIDALASCLSAAKESCREFIEKPEAYSGPSGEKRRLNGFLFKGVPSTVVTEFLEQYQCPRESAKTNPERIAKFIGQMVSKHGELVDWDVYVNAAGADERRTWGNEVLDKVPLAQRQLLANASDRYSIRRLLGGNEEDLLITSPGHWSQCMDLTKELRKLTGKKKSDSAKDSPSGQSIRKCSDARRGLLILYAFDVMKVNRDTKEKTVMTTDCPLVGFAVSLPESQNCETVEYMANEIAIENE